MKKDTEATLQVSQPILKVVEPSVPTALRNFASVIEMKPTKIFYYKKAYVVHPWVSMAEYWDENWFGNYE